MGVCYNQVCYYRVCYYRVCYYRVCYYRVCYYRVCYCRVLLYLNWTIHKYKHLFEKFQFIRFDNTFKLLNEDLFEYDDTQLFWESHILRQKSLCQKPKDGQKISCVSLCPKYNICGVPMFFTYEPQVLWGCWNSVRGWKNRLRGISDVLGSKGLFGVKVGSGQVSYIVRNYFDKVIHHRYFSL